MNEEEGTDYINANYIPVRKIKPESSQWMTVRASEMCQPVKKRAIPHLATELQEQFPLFHFRI
jgi:hypothetical protein